jgi:hypothetical protein
MGISDNDFKCNKGILECICGSGCPCRKNHTYTHLNVVPEPLTEGENAPYILPEVKWINVRGRDEHEAVLKDAAWCEELGLDQAYEILVYLKRWGSWLGE